MWVVHVWTVLQAHSQLKLTPQNASFALLDTYQNPKPPCAVHVPVGSLQQALAQQAVRVAPGDPTLQHKVHLLACSVQLENLHSQLRQ